MRPATVAELRRQAGQRGIRPTYTDAWGKRRHVAAETLAAALDALGPVPDPQRLPVVVDGSAPGLRTPIAVPGVTAALLVLEDGTTVEPGIRADAVILPPDLPPGRHRLRFDTTSRAERWILVSPGPAVDPSLAPGLALFTPLHALTSDHGHDLGDLSDLDRLGAAVGPVVDRPLGLALLPLLATDPADPSPYSPVSRRYWNELHLDLSALPGGADALAEPELAQRIERRRADRHVDWRAVAADVHRVLDSVVDRLGPALDPNGYPDPDLAAYAAHRARGDDRAGRRHLVGQLAMGHQLTDLVRSLASRGQSLVLDLPIGSAADGFDVTCDPAAFVTGWSVGAPPDVYFPRGQSWGFPPTHPVGTRLDGHTLFSRSVAAPARYASVLRIDHVMGLERLWWVPPGADAAEGVYVEYPTNELLAILSIESHLHQTVLVGEDLGTVSPGIRRATQRAAMLGMYEEQFAMDRAHLDGLPPVPRAVVAGLNTHDMATFHALVDGTDIDERRSLGLLTAPQASAAARDRVRAMAAYRHLTGAGRAAPATALLDVALDRLARSKAAVVSIGLEDLWLEPEAQNMPGTSTERSNWTRRMAKPVEAVAHDPEVAHRLQLLATGREIAESRRGSPTAERSTHP